MRLRDVSNQMPSAENFLNALGLEMRRSTSESMLSSLAIFAAGVTIGVAAGLLFAPRAAARPAPTSATA